MPKATDACRAGSIAFATFGHSRSRGEKSVTMRIFKGTLRNSIYGLLGNPATPSDSVLESGTEDIREASEDPGEK